MSDVAKHYETLLARHYSWMVGGEFNATVTAQQALLEALGVRGNGLAIDLGCGPGYQAVALVRLGYAPVCAVDGNQTLLNELAGHARGLAIESIHADIRTLKKFSAPESASAIVCMGDTLPHLQSLEEVAQLLADAHQMLTFRDLSIERSGLDRFIPVRSDADRIMTCVLEFERDHVVVNDLIHVRQDADWLFHKSSYRKVRLGVKDVLAGLQRLGFKVQVNKPLANGMQAIAAVKR